MSLKEGNIVIKFTMIKNEMHFLVNIEILKNFPIGKRSVKEVLRPVSPKTHKSAPIVIYSIYYYYKASQLRGEGK